MPRISQLPSLTAADNADEIAIVDVSASTTKKITRGDLLKAPLPTNSVTTAAVSNGSITSQKIDYVSHRTASATKEGDAANQSSAAVGADQVIQPVVNTDFNLTTNGGTIIAMFHCNRVYIASGTVIFKLFIDGVDKGELCRVSMSDNSVSGFAKVSDVASGTHSVYVRAINSAGAFQLIQYNSTGLTAFEV